VYVQYRRIPASSTTTVDKSIVMFHIDILTNNGPLRLSVSSMFDQITMAGHALRVPLNPCLDGRWTVFALDIPKLLKKHVSRSSEYKLIRSVRLCANMAVRDVFTSHQAFTFMVKSICTFQDPPHFILFFCYLCYLACFFFAVENQAHVNNLPFN
jgi:hypothetical protein